jgi:hypothetical protein
MLSTIPSRPSDLLSGGGGGKGETNTIIYKILTSQLTVSLPRSNIARVICDVSVHWLHTDLMALLYSLVICSVYFSYCDAFALC